LPVGASGSAPQHNSERTLAQGPVHCRELAACSHFDSRRFAYGMQLCLGGDFGGLVLCRRRLTMALFVIAYALIWSCVVRGLRLKAVRNARPRCRCIWALFSQNTRKHGALTCPVAHLHARTCPVALLQCTSPAGVPMVLHYRAAQVAAVNAPQQPYLLTGLVHCSGRGCLWSSVHEHINSHPHVPYHGAKTESSFLATVRFDRPCDRFRTLVRGQ
jgi:hypothetical protein